MKKTQIAMAMVLLAFCIFVACFGVAIIVRKPLASSATATNVDIERPQAIRLLRDGWQALQEANKGSGMDGGVCSPLVKWYHAHTFEIMMLKYNPEPEDFDFMPSDFFAVKHQIAMALVSSVTKSKGTLTCGAMSGVGIVETAMEALQDDGGIAPGREESTSAALRQALIRQVKPALATPNKEIATERTVADIVKQYGLTAAELKR